MRSSARPRLSASREPISSLESLLVGVRGHRPRRAQRAGHGRLIHAQLGRELGGRGLPAQPARELVARARQPAAQLRETARQSHALAAVAQVTLDLAGDVRHGEGGQVEAALEIEAIDGVDQADRPDLHEVLVTLAAACVTACERLHEGQMELDQALAGLGVAVHVVSTEESRGRVGC